MIRAALALLLAAAVARAGEPIEISMPLLGAVYRFDPDTNTFTPFCTGLGIPFYGTWADDGFLYMPDRSYGIVWRIGEDGVPHPFAAGGWLNGVVTVLVAPDGSLVASDIFSETIVRLDASGGQTLIADGVSSGGLLSGPGGMAYGPDGTLYVANNITNTIAAVDDVTGDVTIVSDGQGLLDKPGGIAVDGAGNLFAANYSSGYITRIRLDTGEASIFCSDGALIAPNDLRLLPKGGLRITSANHVLGVIGSTGQLTILTAAAGYGDWDGNVARSDRPACSGSLVAYGTGLAGSGGFVPELRAVFSPCPGASVALELRRLLGGTHGSLAWGLGAAALPFKGGTLLVNIGPPGGLIPLVFPGVGPGAGELTVPFVLPDDPALTGVSFYMQVLAADPGAVKGISQSNGLQEQIGS